MIVILCLLSYFSSRILHLHCVHNTMHRSELPSTPTSAWPPSHKNLDMEPPSIADRAALERAHQGLKMPDILLVGTDSTPWPDLAGFKFSDDKNTPQFCIHQCRPVVRVPQLEVPGYFFRSHRILASARYGRPSHAPLSILFSIAP